MAVALHILIATAHGGEPGPAAGSAHRPALLLGRCWTAADLAPLPGETEVLAVGRARDAPAPGLPPDAPARPTPDRAPPVASIRGVRPRAGDRSVALTFNLIERPGEVSGYDAALIEALRRAPAPATFFASGRWMQSHPERTRQLMADPLFELGSLGLDHRNLALLGAGESRAQWLLAEAVYRGLREDLAQRGCAADAAGRRALARIAQAPTLLRFPYGRCEQRDLAIAAPLGLPVIQWSLVLDDIATDADPRAIAERAAADLERLGPGAIVVAHGDGRGRGTAQAVGLLLAYLRDHDYRPVKVSELLARGEAIRHPTCYEHQPGDNRIYDQRFRD